MGLTPGRSVEAARHLSAATAAPAKRIAERCGIGSVKTMRRSLARVLVVAPASYRERFGPR